MYLKTAILMFFSHSRNTYLWLLLVCLSEFGWDFGLRVLFANNLFVTDPEDVCYQNNSVLAVSHLWGQVFMVYCKQPSDWVLFTSWGSSVWCWTFSSAPLPNGCEPFSSLWVRQTVSSYTNHNSAAASWIPRMTLRHFAAHWWSLPAWKAPFPALCKDLKGFIKFGVLAL